MKKIPHRTCVGCLSKIEKHRLIRVIRNKEGAFAVDNTLKAQARGAYICKTAECIEKARKRKGFERSFKCSLAGEKNIYDTLEKEV